MEHGSQTLHQLPEIHPLVGGEEKQDLAAVKGHLGGDQLHIQPLFFDLLDADLIGLFFLFPVVPDDLFVLGVGQPQNIAQRGNHILFRNVVVSAGADAEFGASGGVDDHMIAGLQLQIPGGKIIDLLAGAELNVHDLHRLCGDSFFHGVLLIAYGIAGKRGPGAGSQ